MKKHLAFLAAALVAVAPMAHAQTTTAPAPRAERGSMKGMRGPGHGDMYKSLNLTDAQKAQVKAIHQKYASQFKSAREASKPDFDAMRAARQKGDTAAMRAAREKLRADMAPTQKVREQEMAEVRAILTPAQQQQLDAMKAKFAERGAKGGHWGKRGGAHKGAATGAGAQ
jgi:Spy/CpxP family protein refolding chaperone